MAKTKNTPAAHMIGIDEEVENPLEQDSKPARAKKASSTQKTFKKVVSDLEKAEDNRIKLTLDSQGDRLVRVRGTGEFAGTRTNPGSFKRLNLALPQWLVDEIDIAHTGQTLGDKRGTKRTATIAGLVQFALDTLKEQGKTLNIRITDEDD